MLIRPCQPQLLKFFDFFLCLNLVAIKHLWLFHRVSKKQPLTGREIVQNTL